MARWGELSERSGMELSKKRAGELLERFKSRRVLVVGDLMLDRFVYGSVARISPEAPVPVVRVTRETAMPGGASNVATNIRALGAKASVAGVLGKDNDGVELKWLLEHAGVETGCAVQFPGAKTIVKERIIAERQQVVRVDFEQPMNWTPRQREDVLARLALELDKADGVIIEDYGKGAVTQAVADLVMQKAHRVMKCLLKINHGLRLQKLINCLVGNKMAQMDTGISNQLL